MRKLTGVSSRTRRTKRLLTALAFAPVAAAAPAEVWAQTAPQVVPPTREEVTRPDPRQDQRKRPTLEVEGGIERAPCALDNPDFANVRFTPRAFVFEGLKGVPPQALVPAYAPLVGREQPVAVLCDVRDRAGTILRQAGYLASVEVPEQRIADGTVRFRVLMAKLVDVRVRGDATGAEQTIAGYLRQLIGQDAFNRYEAERYLLLASDLPGYNVRLTLQPAGTVPGEVVGLVTVLRTPAFADANIQNYGSEEIGRWGGLIRGQLFGLTGLADRTTLAAFATADLREQRTLQLGHDFRVGPEGLGLGGMLTYSRAKPTIAGDPDIRSRTVIATFQADYPLVRSLARDLRGTVGMDIVNQDLDLDTIDLTRDRLRVAFARLALDSASPNFFPGRSPAEPLWRLTSSLELRKGLDIFGATENCGPTGANCLGPGDVPPSRLEGQATAAVVRGSLYGEYRPAPLFTLALGGRAQYARKPLLSFEEFSAGNYTVGRGYDPGALLSDRGWGTQAEIRVGSTIPDDPRQAAVQGYAFWDHARVRNLDRLTIVEGSNDLDSVGAGARVTYDRFLIDGTIAVPLTRIGILDEKRDPRVLISITSRLWPWRYR